MIVHHKSRKYTIELYDALLLDKLRPKLVSMVAQLPWKEVNNVTAKNVPRW